MERVFRLRLPPLPQSAAEAALGDFWTFLEKHGLSTPGLAFEFEANKDVCITLMENSLETIALLQAWVDEYERRCEESGQVAI